MEFFPDLNSSDGKPEKNKPLISPSHIFFLELNLFSCQVSRYKVLIFFLAQKIIIIPSALTLYSNPCYIPAD